MKQQSKYLLRIGPPDSQENINIRLQIRFCYLRAHKTVKKSFPLQYLCPNRAKTFYCSL